MEANSIPLADFWANMKLISQMHLEEEKKIHAQNLGLSQFRPTLHASIC